jgi:hypothetical protein
VHSLLNNGLGTNGTRGLELSCMSPLRDDNIGCGAGVFSFLHTNKAIKSLVIDMHLDATNSCLSTFRVAITAMLEDNTSLEGFPSEKAGKAMRSRSCSSRKTTGKSSRYQPGERGRRCRRHPATERSRTSVSTVQRRILVSTVVEV